MRVIQTIFRVEEGILSIKPKRAVLCNQSSYYAKTLKVNTALQSVFIGTKRKRTDVCNQSSNYAKTLKGEYSAAVSLLWYNTWQT